MSIENDQPTTYHPPGQWPDQSGHQPAYGQMGPTPPPSPAPEPEKRKRKWILPASLAVAGLVLGFGAGVGNKPEPVTIEKVVEKEVEVEVIKEVTPPSCIEALDKASDVIQTLYKLAPIAKDSITAVAENDPTALDAQTQKIKDLNADIEDQTGPLGVSVGDCRGSAE